MLALLCWVFYRETTKHRRPLGEDLSSTTSDRVVVNLCDNCETLVVPRCFTARVGRAQRVSVSHVGTRSGECMCTHRPRIDYERTHVMDISTTNKNVDVLGCVRGDIETETGDISIVTSSGEVRVADVCYISPSRGRLTIRGNVVGNIKTRSGDVSVLGHARGTAASARASIYIDGSRTAGRSVPL